MYFIACRELSRMGGSSGTRINIGEWDSRPHIMLIVNDLGTVSFATWQYQNPNLRRHASYKHKHRHAVIHSSYRESTRGCGLDPSKHLGRRSLKQMFTRRQMMHKRRMP
jgi:hypothetical protein